MNAHFIQVDAEFVKQQIFDLRTQFPELESDEDFALDVFEGQTDLFSIAAKAIEIRAESESMVAAIKERVSDLTSRKSRFERRSDAMRKLIKGLMDAAGQTKLTLPEATLSISKGREKIVIDNVDDLVQGFYRTERIADKEAIKTALDAGADVPGAHKEVGETSLTMRTK
jgi:hypothetical protein